MELKKRTWGWYWTVFSGDKFKIKFLYFKKGLSCSMQRHFQRDELWLFLFGQGVFYRKSGLFSNNFSSRPISAGMIANVELGEWHKYKAIKPTLVLEIQTGDCKEEDIERAA